MRKSILFLIPFILIALSAHGETPGQMAQQAEKLYQKGEYHQAIKLWEGLVELGFNNGSLFNNIASAYWRQGMIGRAKQYFLKARVLEPRDSEIHKNLVFIQNKLGMEKKDEGLKGVLKKIPIWRISLNLSESAIATAILTVIIIGLLFFGKRREKIKPNFILITLVFLWFFSSAQFVYQISRRTFFLEGVVLTSDSNLLPAPTLEAPPLDALREGESLKVLKKRGNFALVKTPSGKEGWTALKDIGEI